MSLSVIVALALYLSLVVSLTWARARFFRISAHQSRMISLAYDPVATAHILLTLLGFYRQAADLTPGAALISSALYGLSLGMFWHTLKAVRPLSYALGPATGTILRAGGFAWVRHPFYVSYSLAWLGSALLLDSLWLWLTLGYLLGFYSLAAYFEEKSLRSGELSQEYSQYQSETGMFFPRVQQWKKWLSGRWSRGTN